MAPRRGRAAAAATASKQAVDEQQPVDSTTSGDSEKAKPTAKPTVKASASRKGKKPNSENGTNEAENAPVELENGNIVYSRKRKVKADDESPAYVPKPTRTRGKRLVQNDVDSQTNADEPPAEPLATTKRAAKSKATKGQEKLAEKPESDEQLAKSKPGKKAAANFEETENVPVKAKTKEIQKKPAPSKRGKKVEATDDAENVTEEAAPSKAPKKASNKKTAAATAAADEPATKTLPKKRKAATKPEVESKVEPASEPAQEKPSGNGRSTTSRRNPAQKIVARKSYPSSVPFKSVVAAKAKVQAKTKESAKTKAAAEKIKKANKDEEQHMQHDDNDVDEIDGSILTKNSSKSKKNAKKVATAAASDAEEHVPQPKKRKPVAGDPAPEIVEEPKVDDDEHTPITVTKRKKPVAKPAEAPEKPKKNKADTDFAKINFESDKEHTLKICSWNVAGLRAFVTKNGHEYFEHEKPDIICLQEIKCLEHQVPQQMRLKDYHPYWCSTPGGHGGVALLTRKMPYNVDINLGDAEMDEEGRIITADYTKFYLVCVYVPNAARGLVNLDRRLRWNKLFEAHVNKLKQSKPVIICGDMNVAHNEIGKFLINRF